MQIHFFYSYFPSFCILLLTETNCCCHIPCLFTSFKVFPALCGKEKYFLSRFIRLSTDAHFVNLLWKPDRAEKLFERVIQQTEREKSANSSHLADLQVFAQGEIRHDAGLWRKLQRAAQGWWGLAWSCRVWNEIVHPPLLCCCIWKQQRRR